MSEWAKELLKDVAREAAKEQWPGYPHGQEVFLPRYIAVLERRLLGLLLGGELANEAVLKGLRYFKGNQEDAILTIAEDGSTLTDFQVTAKAAKLQWDAAKAAAMKEPT